MTKERSISSCGPDWVKLHPRPCRRDPGDADRPVSTITMRLEDVDGKTKLTVNHAGMASEKYPAENFAQGWSESLDRLAACVADR